MDPRRRPTLLLRFFAWLFLAIVAVSAFFFRDRILGSSTDLDSLKEKTDLFIQEITKDVVAPPPLRGQQNAAASRLTEDGVVRETNEERVAAGLAPLRTNARLATAAALKLKDLFEGQYFGHISPTGEGPSHWADAAGYSYLVLGENLALGNFEDDAALVAAWIASPGHRENILGPRYQEIGVAVGREMYEGQMTWIAVQEFGRPFSACQEPSVVRKTQIAANEKGLLELEQALAAKRTELEQSSKKDRDAYNQRVDEYNKLAAEYNALLEKTRALVNEYNAEVRRFNVCAAE